jgi:hypothetical protein
LVVVHDSRDALEIFGRELGSIGLSCAPGTTGIYSGRPKPTPVVRLFTLFLDKILLGNPKLTVGPSEAVEVPVPMDGGYVAPEKFSAPAASEEKNIVTAPLIKLAYARSGDKGNSSNIAQARISTLAAPHPDARDDRLPARPARERPGRTL